MTRKRDLLPEEEALSTASRYPARVAAFEEDPVYAETLKSMRRERLRGTRLVPEPGYVYTLGAEYTPGHPGYRGQKDWKSAPDEAWDTEMLSASLAKLADHVGQRKIDETKMNVYRIFSFHVAQLPQNARRIGR